MRAIHAQKLTVSMERERRECIERAYSERCSEDAGATRTKAGLTLPDNPSTARSLDTFAALIATERMLRKTARPTVPEAKIKRHASCRSRIGLFRR